MPHFTTTYKKTYLAYLYFIFVMKAYPTEIIETFIDAMGIRRMLVQGFENKNLSPIRQEETKQTLMSSQALSLDKRPHASIVKHLNLLYHHLADLLMVRRINVAIVSSYYSISFSGSL
jgi:hypothetical protein